MIKSQRQLQPLIHSLKHAFDYQVRAPRMNLMVSADLERAVMN